MAGASFIVAVQMVGSSEKNTALAVSLGCFAIVSPFAVTFALWPERYPMARLSDHLRKRIQRTKLVITLVFSAGILTLFFSLGLIFGMLLFVAAGLASGVGNAAVRAVRKGDSDDRSG
jgi:MFS family permease